MLISNLDFKKQNHIFTQKIQTPTIKNSSTSKKQLNSCLVRAYSEFRNFARQELDMEEMKKFKRFASQQIEDPYNQYKLIQKNATKALKSVLSNETLRLIDNLAQDGKTSLLLLKNSPVYNNQLPDTPTNDKKPKDKDFVSEYFMLGIAGLLNSEPHIADTEKDGSVIQQIIPLDEKAVAGTGFKEPFEFHTENAHEECPPDYFMLLCLKGDKEANTIYYFLDTLIDSLPKEVVDELQKPNFIMKTGDSYTVFDSRKDAPLKKNENGFYEIKLNTAPNRCEALTPEASYALDYIKDFFKYEPKPSVNLEQGDLLLLNNKRTFHGRTAFDISTPFSERRWLQRLYTDKQQNFNREV